MSRVAVAAVVALLAMAVDSASAQPASPNQADATKQAIPYLAVAGQGDVFEVTTSQIAILRSKNPQVREFASMLIDHHTRTTDLSLAAAKKGGIMPPPPVLDARHRKMIDELMAASGTNFDKVYMSQQIPAHQAALQLHSGYAETGDVETLRTTAKGAVPIIKSHLARAQTLQPAM